MFFNLFLQGTHAVFLTIPACDVANHGPRAGVPAIAKGMVFTGGRPADDLKEDDVNVQKKSHDVTNIATNGALEDRADYRPSFSPSGFCYIGVNLQAVFESRGRLR